MGYVLCEKFQRLPRLCDTAEKTDATGKNLWRLFYDWERMPAVWKTGEQHGIINQKYRLHFVSMGAAYFEFLHSCHGGICKCQHGQRKWFFIEINRVRQYD